MVDFVRRYLSEVSARERLCGEIIVLNNRTVYPADAEEEIKELTDLIHQWDMTFFEKLTLTYRNFKDRGYSPPLRHGFFPREMERNRDWNLLDENGNFRQIVLDVADSAFGKEWTDHRNPINQEFKRWRSSQVESRGVGCGR